MTPGKLHDSPSNEVERMIEDLRDVSVWKRGKQRAPHKPLLLLFALASLQRNEPRLTNYSSVHDQLGELLREFGPPRQSVHPEYPFWRLQNDGNFWDIPQRDAVIQTRGNQIKTGDIPPSVLSQVDCKGGFSKPLHTYLSSHPNIVNDLAQMILEEHFPSSLHEGLLSAVGMPATHDQTIKAKRDPEFRRKLLRLYEHRCAICSFDGRLGNTDIGLEAAHVKWHSQGGPDEPQNGLLLCSLHHLAFDRGAIGLTSDRKVCVSQHVHGGPVVDDVIIGLNGNTIATPIDPAAALHQKYISWHKSEVFRCPARPV
ncbi:phosphorothioated DNA-binding restriction endonuclease [Nitrincola sp.]|uniref:phosphorothioated DNA-binding restriction endonuclease n=1 Tax=Nitrincola sp. TaxID=1926584 RepID=UPI003A926FA5